MDTFYLSMKERLREEGRGGTVVVVDVVTEVRIELDVAVVEVEVRGTRKVAVGVRNFVFAHLQHQALNFTTFLSKGLFIFSPEFYLAVFIMVIKPAPDKNKQYLFKIGTLLEALTAKILVIFSYEREVRRQ